MWAAAIVAVVVTAVVLVAAFRRELGLAATHADERAPARFGVGVVAIALSAVLVLTLTAPALPVLAVGIAAVLADRVGWARIHEIVDVRVLAGLFVVAVALGAVGRWWDGPASLLGHLGRVGTALAGAVAAALRQQPSRRGPLDPARARSSARAPDRPEPRPEPRGDGIALRVPLAPRRAEPRREAVGAHLLVGRAWCSCRSRSAPHWRRSGWSRPAASDRWAAEASQRASGTGR